MRAKRMSGALASEAIIAPLRSRNLGLPPQSGCSMLDCPPHSHTSPTSTLFTATVLSLPAAVSVRLSLQAGIGARRSVHAPLSSALALTLWPAKATVTSSCGSAAPHTATGSSRCRTRLSAKTGARVTLA